jgi:hypothetical protein
LPGALLRMTRLPTTVGPQHAASAKPSQSFAWRIMETTTRRATSQNDDRKSRIKSRHQLEHIAVRARPSLRLSCGHSIPSSSAARRENARAGRPEGSYAPLFGFSDFRGAGMVSCCSPLRDASPGRGRPPG